MKKILPLILIGLIGAAMTGKAQLIQSVAYDNNNMPANSTWYNTGLTLTTVNTGAINCSVTGQGMTPSGASATPTTTFMCFNLKLVNSSGVSVSTNYSPFQSYWDPGRTRWANEPWTIVLATSNLPPDTYTLWINRQEDPVNGTYYSVQFPTVTMTLNAIIMSTGNDPTATIQALADRVTALEQEITDINSQMASMQTDITNLQTQLIEYYSQLTWLKTQINNLYAKVDQNTIDIAGLNDKINDLQGQLTADISNLSGQIGSLQSQVTSLKKKSSDDEILAQAAAGVGSASFASLIGYMIADDGDNPAKPATKETPKSTNQPNKTKTGDSKTPVTQNTRNYANPVTANSTPAPLSYPPASSTK